MSFGGFDDFIDLEGELPFFFVFVVFVIFENEFVFIDFVLYFLGDFDVIVLFGCEYRYFLLFKYFDVSEEFSLLIGEFVDLLELGFELVDVE